MTRLHRCAASAVPAVLASFVLAANAAAAVDSRTVNSTADPGDGSCATNGCTLREAITELNLDFDTTDQDQIQIAFNSIFNSTITLGSTLAISDPVAISSVGTATPTVSGNDAVRAFTISGSPGDDVAVSGLTITDGLTTETIGGGAIRASFADLTISGAAIRDSAATGSNSIGGAISAAGGTLTITDSTLAGNTSPSNGGAVNTSADPFTLRRSTVSSNWTTGTPGPATIGGAGGGISSASTTLIESSTISGNHTEGLEGHGGGVHFGSGAVTVRDSTISGNATQGANANGGNLFAAAPGPTLSNTIVANGAVGTGGVGPDLAGGSFQLAYSLFENTSGASWSSSVPNSNITGQDPALGALGNNGGQTQTHLPGVTSPVLDRGSTDAPVDQRGVPRPNDFANKPNAEGGDAAEIGAVEIPIAPPTFASTSPASPGSDDTPTVFGNAQDGTVRLYTDAACTQATGAATADEVFEASGITVGPVAHNATATFYGRTDTTYGTSLCSSGAFPNTIAYTHVDPPSPPPPPPPAPPPPHSGGAGTVVAGATGERDAALKRCKAKKRRLQRQDRPWKKRYKKCRRRAVELPL